ncbi:MAG: hypothetical protein GQ522_01395 [Deltaproteobacteria bacterium]|nr:hypothetical protein [Deltaproteobacteria bacterium]
MKIPRHLREHISPQISREIRLATARGEVSLEPRDLVVALFILGYDKERDVASAARRRFSDLRTDTILTALEGTVDPLILRTIAVTHAVDEAVLLMIALHSDIDDKTLAMLAAKGPEGVVDIIAKNGEILRAHPSIIKALKTNPNLSKATLAKAELLIHPPEDDGGEVSRESGITDVDVDEPDEEKSTYERIKGMNVAEKVKAALLGNKEVRDMLIKANNPMISSAVLRNPRITEEELIRVANSREASDQMLRVIAGNKKYLKNYAIKLGMVTNPKTPLHYSLKFINALHAKDLKNIAKSRNVPGAIARAARRIMDRKGIS